MRSPAASTCGGARHWKAWIAGRLLAGTVGVVLFLFQSPEEMSMSGFLPVIDRICYTADESCLPPTYMNADPPQVADRVCDATLVSSLTPSGMHAPALDIDVPVALTCAPEQGPVLWVDKLTSPSTAKVRAALHRAGLAAEPSKAGQFDGDRRGSYERARAFTVDERPRVAALTKLAPELRCSFADAFTVADATLSGSDGPVETFTAGRAMIDPWPITFTVPAMLLPSTRHHHLYLDGLVEREDYLDLLDSLEGSGLVEDGYVGASREREQTRLRLPWIRKPIGESPF